MACSRPQVFGACNRCRPCRRRRRDELVTRILCEASAHARVSLVTLTYATPYLPENLSLWAPDIVAFRKRLRINWLRAIGRDRRFRHLSIDERKALAALRFFIVGEYGGKFGRPHFHVVVFGADRTMRIAGKWFAQFIREAWGKGRVDPGRKWSIRAAAYVSGYMTKGHNVAGLDVLEGRAPEFCMYPSGQAGGLGRPGLAVMLPDLLDGRSPVDVVAAHDGDVPAMLPLADGPRFAGRFLLGKLRRLFGLTDDAILALKLRHLHRVATERHERWLDVRLGEALCRCSFELAGAVSDKLAEVYSSSLPALDAAPLRRLRRLLNRKVSHV